MSKMRTYPDELKTKIVLEMLREESTLSEISSRYEMAPSALSGWKEQFLKNASAAFSPDKSAEKLKKKLKNAEKKRKNFISRLVN